MAHRRRKSTALEIRLALKIIKMAHTEHDADAARNRWDFYLRHVQRYTDQWHLSSMQAMPARRLEREIWTLSSHCTLPFSTSC